MEQESYYIFAQALPTIFSAKGKVYSMPKLSIGCLVDSIFSCGRIIGNPQFAVGGKETESPWAVSIGYHKEEDEVNPRNDSYEIGRAHV